MLDSGADLKSFVCKEVSVRVWIRVIIAKSHVQCGILLFNYISHFGFSKRISVIDYYINILVDYFKLIYLDIYALNMYNETQLQMQFNHLGNK